MVLFEYSPFGVAPSTNPTETIINSISMLAAVASISAPSRREKVSLKLIAGIEEIAYRAAGSVTWW